MSLQLSDRLGKQRPDMGTIQIALFGVVPQICDLMVKRSKMPANSSVCTFEK
jgi:hypothetical protein